MGKTISERATLFLRHLENFDFTTMRAMCTGTASVWHNDGRGEQAIADKLGRLELLVEDVESLQFDVTRQFHDSNEVLQQNTLRMTMVDGSRKEIHAATYFRFAGFLIDRMEEYVYSVPDAAGAGSSVRVGSR